MVVRKPASHRRGVLLLVVLSILVLFVLLMLSFVAVAGRFRAATVPLGKLERYGTPPRQLLDCAMLELLRDTQNPRSAMLRSSLLADKYGKPGVRVRVHQLYPGDGATRFDASGLGDLSIHTRDLDALDILSASDSAPLGLLPDAIAGREIFWIDTRQVVATRIVRYLPNVSSPDGTLVDRIYVIPWRRESPATFPTPGCTLLVNDAPFDGTGAGFNGQNALDQSIGVHAMGSQPVSYLINRAQLLTLAGGADITALDQLIDKGGQDEPWDAADYQNSFLSCTISDTQSSRTILPSFHRPDLVNYFRATLDLKLSAPVDEFSEAAKQLLRCIVPRPLRFDHPHFTGGNPVSYLSGVQGSYPALGINLIDGPWDVDNDGDGKDDSVWIDLGYPAQLSSDGRSYKPLFAFLVRDLDGRVNVNTAGNLAHADAAYFHQPGEPDFPLPKPVYLDGKWINIPRGMGHGPAEINLGAVLPGTPSWRPFDTILRARYQGHGPGLANATDRSPGCPLVDDFPGSATTQGMHAVPQVPPGCAVDSEFGSPPDVFGRNGPFVASDQVQPGYAVTSFSGSGLHETVDDPYEINVCKPNRFDDVFELTDLESLLRHFDHDAAAIGTYSSRLTAGANRALLGIPRVTELLTTHSFQVPAPPRAPPIHDALQSVPSLPIVQLFETRLRLHGLTDAQIPAAITTIVPFELTRGAKMNVNRPWGNGRDDDPPNRPGYMAVDDPDEFGVTDTMFADYEIPASLDGEEAAPNDIRLSGHYDNGTGKDPRVVYARHLYCLAMFLKDENFTFPIAPEQPGLTAVQRQWLTARRLAQWAVNAADFRDADHIMTAFEYDPNPYDGWDVDGDLLTEEPIRAVVWGCELPVLLLTESLALHDRRVRDLPAHGLRVEDLNGNDLPDDNDLDQELIPQGSLFLELYCPPSTAQNYASADLFSNQGRLDLSRVSPDGENPVWRIAISGAIQDVRNATPNYLDILQRMEQRPNTASFQPMEAAEIERIIWFTEHGPSGVDPLSANTYYNRSPVAPLVGPGQYVVVAPRVATFLGEKSLPSGQTAPSDQAIGISFGADTATIVFRHLDGQYSARHSIVPVIAAADAPHHWTSASATIGVNISEPLVGSEYYPEPDGTNPTTGLKERYLMPIDRPLDSQSLAADRPGDTTKRLADYPHDESGLIPFPTMLRTGLHRHVNTSGITSRWRNAYLQRLANPLRGWHAITNPYITVDMIPIDLTVFNGVGRAATFKLADEQHELDPDDPFLTLPHPFLASCERGDGVNSNRLWPYEYMLPESQTESWMTGADEFFPFQLVQTLGSGNAAIGSSANSFAPWLFWANRPFVSELELLLVPSSSPDRLMMEFDVLSDINPFDRYSQGLLEDSVKAAPFGHLLNFFHGSDQPNSANLYRIFSFLGVPSRFGDTRHNFLHATAGIQHGFDGYWSPNNHLSEGREPGRINLNTIFDRRVWNSLAASYPQHFQRDPSMNSGFYHDFVLSRQGQRRADGSPIKPYEFEGHYPTIFANPFRPGSTSGIVPPLANTVGWSTGAASTLLRPAADRAGMLLFGPTQRWRSLDFVRHPYFFFAGSQRLANLTSTQSNVFAVWLTVGYFEAEPWTDNVPGGARVIDTAHPDGLALGQELGTESGEIRRHRAFYVIDRSVPVAYEPGQDNNADQAILLSRFIE